MPRAFQRSVGVASYWPFHSKRQRDITRRLAGQAVKSAIKNGTLTRQKCERCVAGDQPKRGRRPAVEAHHEDYAQPLSVVWLCRRHHRQRHAELAVLLPTPDVWQDVRTRENTAVLNACVSVEPVVRDVTTQLLGAMDSKGIAQAHLAKRMGVSRQHVGSYFGGGIRTLKALVAVADAIGCDVVIQVIDRPVNSEAKAS